MFFLDVKIKDLHPAVILQNIQFVRQDFMAVCHLNVGLIIELFELLQCYGTCI